MTALPFPLVALMIFTNRPSLMGDLRNGRLTQVAGIAGTAFGAAGKSYLRFSLVSARPVLEEALGRIERVSMRWRAAVSR